MILDTILARPASGRSGGTLNRPDRIGRAWKRRTAGLGLVVALLSFSALPASAASVIDTIPVGTNPSGVAFSPDGSTAYVINETDDTVSVIDVATGTTGTPITVGNSPRAVAFSPDGSTAYVTNVADNTVSVIDVAAGTTGTPITVGSGPLRVAFSPDGSTAYVTNWADGTVSVIAVDTVAVLAPPATLPTPVLGSPFSFTVQVTAGSPAATFSITAGALPAGLTMDETTGVISGTPVTAGAFSFTVTATNSSGTASATYTGTIEVQLAATGLQRAPLLELAVALTLVGGALVLVRRRFA